MKESQYKLAEYIQSLFREKRLKEDYRVEDLMLLIIDDLKTISNNVKEI